MSTQPNNILLSFTNVDTLSTDGGRSNTTNYYYKDGEVYIDGQENIPEFKRLNLSNDQLSKTTRVLTENESGMNNGTYTSPDGFDIDYDIGDEIFVVHNYTGNTQLDDVERKLTPNSWWYDVSLHKMYRVYLKVGYLNSETREEEQVFDWRVKEVKKVYKSHTEDPQSGIYSFPSPPPEDIGITGSVKIDTNSGGNVWETVKLKLFYNDSVIGSTTVDTTTTTLPTTMNVLVDRTKDSIQSTNELRMSVEVSTAPTLHNDALIVTEYSMSISSPSKIDSPETILGFSNNLGLARDFDCQPTINNTMVTRQSEFVQDVDYSISSEGSGSVTPQNLSQILKNQAEKATVPDSNYTQYSSVIPKYYGSKTNREGINIPTAIAFNSSLVDDSPESDLYLSPFYFATDNLGSFPNVESKNSYLGYFEKIIDPYPLLNNKTAYYVRYLVDRNTDVLDPSLSPQGLSNLKNTFKLNDVNNLPTSVKASVQNIDEARELKDLETLSTVYSVGEYPTTVLYSQTSSIGYSNRITLSGSSEEFLANYDGTDENYRNLAFTAADSLTNDTLATAKSRQIVLDEDYGNSLRPGNVEFIPPANQEAYLGNTGTITINNELTDEYFLTVDYSFFTSHLPPQMSFSTIRKNYWGQVVFEAKDQNDSLQRFEEVNVRLLQWSNSNETGVGSVQEVALETNRPYSYPLGAPLSNGYLVNKLTAGQVQINFDSHQIYQALEGELYLRDTRDQNAAEDWSNKTSQEADREAEIDKLRSDKGNYLEWKVRLKVKLPEPTINPVTGAITPSKLKIFRTGIMEVEENYSKLNQTISNDYRYDRFFTSGNNTSLSPGRNYKRTFSPFGIEGSEITSIKFDLRGAKTPSAAQLGVAHAPFWSFLPNSSARNKIYLVNSLLNNNYSFNYYQVDLEYNPERSTDFPFSKEPSFMRMPSATNQWEIKIGDEFRFENLESKVFEVTSVGIKTIGGEDKLEVTFDKNIPNGTTLDFFVIRRFKPSNNFVILNQQKPYGVPLSASSSPGILQTQYQSEELETNPDKVITNLIERNLI